MTWVQWVAIKLGYNNVYSIFHHIQYNWIAETIDLLCLVHLVKQFPELFNLCKPLISTWKLFTYSSTKNSTFLKAQEAMNLKPLKILQAYTKRWLTHGESRICIISRNRPPPRSTPRHMILKQKESEPFCLLQKIFWWFC